jgi:hypothetical protein
MKRAARSRAESTNSFQAESNELAPISALCPRPKMASVISGNANIA